MPKIEVFDPVLCCSTGICGVDIDQQLIDFAADSAWAVKQGGQIHRFNLGQEPLEFANNTVVNAFLQRSGQESLPLVLVDGDIALAGRYPTKNELARWANLSLTINLSQPSSQEPCCGGDSNC